MNKIKEELIMNLKQFTIISAVAIGLSVPFAASADNGRNGTHVNQSVSIHGNGNTVNQSVHVTNNYGRSRGHQGNNNRYNKKARKLRKLRRELRRLKRGNSRHHRGNRGHGRNNVRFSITFRH